MTDQSQIIHRLFMQQAGKTPQHAAVSFGSQTVSYQELNERSNQLAHWLRAHNAGGSEPIAIMLDRSVEMIVALLGVLKAGAAFVPLDPKYPFDRLEMIIAEVAPRWVITERAYLETIGALLQAGGQGDARVQLLEEHAGFPSWAELDAYPVSAVECSSEPEDLIYVFYTSGSTGRPKGVMGSHKSLSHFIRWEVEEFDLGEGDRISQFAALSFDACLRDIFVPLCSGGTVCLPQPEVVLDREELVRWLQAERLTLVHCVPSVFRQLLAALQEMTPEERAGLFPHLRYILMAGEVLEVKHVRAWMDMFGLRIKLVNLYGSTETTMIKMFHVIDQLPPEGKPIPVGKGMKGAVPLILNEKGKLCGIGKVGEIYIRSPYLSLGYYKRPELTAEVFLQNPLQKDKPDRVYRTGDLGKYLPDGTVEYIGRRDNQVKVRGNRVELAEIEAVLTECAGVHEATVVAQRDEEGDYTLFAFFTGRDTLTVEELRAFCQSKVPEYMIPAQFHWLGQMPLLPNGKIDRKALQALQVESSPLLGTAYVEPTSENERRLAAIWAEVLKLEQVGIRNNFFTLGGHSLLAMQARARIKDETGIDVKLKDLFQYATIEQLAKHLDQLSADGPAAGSSEIAVLPKQSAYELSHGQKRLWFLQKMEPQSVAYNMPYSVTLKGALHLPAFQAALQKMAERHASLRTVFAEEDGVVRQIVLDAAQIPFSIHDLTGLEADEQEARMRKKMDEDARTPFSLTDPPLLRTMLFGVGEEEHHFYLNMHHIISDGWSMGLLIAEFAEFYHALSHGQEALLEPLAIHYTDFAAWQNQQLAEGVLDHEEAYWMEKLSKPLPVLNLPLDFERPAVMTDAGAVWVGQIDAQLIERARRFAEAEETSLYMVLLAVYNLLLHRLTGDEDIIVGTPTAGRTTSALEGLIGIFINMLGIRTRFDEQDTFRSLLRQVKNACLEAFDHQSYPFDMLIEKIKPETDLSRSAVFSTLFVLQNAPFDLRLPGLDVQESRLHRQASKYDIALKATEHANGLELLFEYNSDLFRAETVQNIADQFASLLESVLANAEQGLYETSLLTERDRRILGEMNATASDYDLDRVAYEAFIGQAQAHPERIALTYEGQSMTYGELHARSNSLAHFLRAQGVGPNQLVSLLMERSLETIVGVYGILKAGAAYVPIDPEYPEWRIQYTLENAASRIVLTKQSYLPHVQAIRGQVPALEMIVLLDDGTEAADAVLWPDVQRFPSDTPEIVNSPSDMAYMIYTSGSTGQPKGTMIPHRALVNCMNWWQEQFPIDEQDCVAQKTSVCFDASVYELFWPLRHGAKMAIIPTETVIDAYRLREKLVSERVTAIKFVPTLFNSFVYGLSDMGAERAALPHLRWIFIGGEALSQKTVNLWYHLFGAGAGIVNQYGPTEATIDVTIHKMTGPQTSNIPIGKPMANTQLYVLDAHGSLCPVGVTGELHIGGVQVADGYYNDAAKTDAVFLPNHLPNTPGDHLYRTGDLGRVLHDGTIEYVGRKDSQVKVRGFRIELGEIEEALLQHPQVESVGVIVHAGNDGVNTLVAFFTGSQPEVDVAGLKSYLGKLLPTFMVPPFIRQIDTMPITPNNKVDRKVLAALAKDEALETVREYVAPSTPTEERVAAIWCDVLRMEQVGRRDNFFELGGHSLLLMQVHSRIRSGLQVALELKDMFLHPTLAELSSHVESLGSAGETKRIERAPEQAHYELSHAQKRLWFLHKFYPENTAYHVNRNVRLRGALRPETFEAALQLLVARHASLRTVFREVDEHPRQFVLAQSNFCLEQEDLAYLEEAKQRDFLQAKLAATEAQPFDLSEGPLLRAMLYRLGEEEFAFLLQMHHIITDAWSRNVFVQELIEVYAALAEGREPVLPELELQYVDYAEWQGQQSGLLAKEESYWLNTLAKPLPVLELPLDTPRPEVQTYNGAVVADVLPPEVVEGVRRAARQQGVSMFMFLLSAYVHLLQHLTGHEDIIVGTPVAGRTAEELEPVIGFFINTLAIRVQLDEVKTPHDLLQAVKNQCLDAYEHQSYPFDQLMERLNPERDMSRSQVFSTMFQFEVDHADLLQGEHFTIEVEPEQSVQPSVKFDLDVMTFERQDGGIDVFFQYNTDLFAKETVQKFTDLFVQAVELFAKQLHEPFGTVHLLAARDRRVIEGINDNQRPYDNRQLMFEEFVRQAKSHPERIALRCEGETMTYGELHERSNQTAHFLRAQGVGRNQLVAIMLERGLEMVVGLYGILKAGGAYVGIDPEYPPQRVQYMIQDSGASVLLSKRAFQAEITASLEEGSSLKRVLFLDTEPGSTPDIAGVITHSWAEVKRYPSVDLEPVSAPDDLGYMIYTSGSTGQPKGVTVTHAAILNNLNWHQETFTLTPDDVVTQRTTVCFDDSVVELFWPLRTGASLSIVSRELITDPERLVAHILECGVTCMIFVPSLFALLVAHLQGMSEAARPHLPLRMVFLGGEALPPKLVNQWFDVYPNGAKIINLYGPTEAAVDSTCSIIEGPVSGIVIGQPLANTQAYVLTKYGAPAPVNVPGELHIGGAQLAVGYHNKPDKTAESFIRNHLPHTPGERLYRTGDLARIRPDGQIEYLGRIDNQVKVRGFRIELGEIEDVMAKFPGVETAVVIAHRQADDNNSLYGCFTANDKVDVNELKQFLGTKLPYYMVPPRLQQLDAIPVLPNGKVDRKALAVLAAEDSYEPTVEFVAPSTKTEATLAAIWSAVLKRERVSVRDNFFELGGHSLLAIQIFNRIRQELRAEVALKDLFAFPVLAELAVHIDRLVTSGRGVERLNIEPAPKQEHYALSRAQKRLWFACKMNPNSPLYNVPQEIAIKQELDVQLLEAALQRLVMRHDSLRTVFVEIDGEPRQKVNPSAPVRLFYKDLTEMSAEEQHDSIRNLIRLSESKPFDLNQGPLMRAMLFKREEGHYHFYINQHHIITDGWSIEVLLREMIAIYQALADGEAEPKLADLPLQYTDYAQWQERELAGGRWQEDENYWLETLAKPLPTLELLTDFPRPEVPSHRGDAVRLTLPKELTRQLRARASESGLSMYMLLLTGYVLFLHQQTHAEDIIVGTPIAGRLDEALEPIVGFFVNSLAIRTRLDGVQTLDDLMQQVKEQFLNAYRHQAYPFDLLIEKVNPDRDLSRSPIYSVMFTYTPPVESVASFDFEPVPNEEHQVSKFDMIANLSETDADELLLRIEYSTDLFRQETVERFAAAIGHALQALVDTPQAPLHELDLLTEQDRTVYAGMNDTTVAHRSSTIHELFEEQAALHADRPAVSCGDRVITYRELNERANQLAHLLRGRGVTTNRRVGIMMERSIEAVAAMFGVLKAGGGYVPIDPEYPADRIAHMLEDSEAMFLITERHLRDALTAEQLERAICIEEVPCDLPTDNLDPVSTVQDLAYMIYTSGSTGKPKGILLRHAGVPSLVQWKRDVIGHGRDDVTVQFASFSFDASILEIFGTLLNGERLHILVQDERMSHQAFADTVARVGGSFTLLPTVFFKMLATYLSEEDADKLASFRAVIVAGEALPPEAVRAWQRRFGTKIRVLNFYGPSEITVGCTAHVMDDYLPAEQTTVPIGKPFHNCKLYIVNRWGQLCPIGVVGEVCINSVGLAAGYINLPERTAESFVPNPFAEAPGSELYYKSGDLARILPSGEIEYMGRLDHQVKVRGFRVEIGEIEEVLLKVPGVEYAAVLPKQDVTGNTMLFAYFTTDGQPLHHEQIKSGLLEKLPDYMMPSHFEQIEAMPLSPSGKVDRKALLARSEGQGQAQVPEPDAAAARPDNAVQAELYEIWAEALEHAAFGIDDNFFDVGGHSILVAKVHNALKERGYAIPMHHLFNYPTIRTLAEALAAQTENVPVKAAEPTRKARVDRQQEDVAIVGMALRFPEASTPDEFWQNLREGRESVREFPREELEIPAFSPFAYEPEMLDQLVRVAGLLDDIDQFDPAFFSITEREARLMDPQHRLFLECVWEAIEDAGYNVDDLEGDVSVYGGVGNNEYLPRGAHIPNFTRADLMQANQLSQPRYLTSRVSYKLNLTGESILVDAACSTSLVAVHMACQSLLSGQSDYALAGASSIQMPQKTGYLYEPGMIMSPDGHCRAFDEEANGSANGSGVGVVLLKRLSDAQRDGDPIYAVIKGSAINNDGNMKVGFSAPSQSGQVSVIAKAQAMAGVHPDDITLIEAHGTATSLGDVIEVSALTEVFRSQTQRSQYCALGSVKTNVGHLGAAAGMAGLIKTALALHHRELPRSLNFRKANPELKLEQGPFFVNTEHRPWETDGSPRRAGVHSFGIGGTNAHIILEEPPSSSS